MPVEMTRKIRRCMPSRISSVMMATASGWLSLSLPAVRMRSIKARENRTFVMMRLSSSNKLAFDQFVANRIAKPLSLSDTGFYVPSEKLERIAETQIDPATGKRWPTFDVAKRPNLMSGGAGMVSTASDYFRFAQMLLNGGELDHVRLLSPRTVAFMTSDHLWPGIAFSPRPRWEIT
jgi:CubicO group peptidase (beta-lactamase class C family)